MGAPVRLCNDLASGANSASVRIRTACRPYAIQTRTGFTGSVAIQNTTANVKISDSAAQWVDVVSSIGPGELATIDHPLTRIRVAGEHSAGTATVDLIENY